MTYLIELASVIGSMCLMMPLCVLSVSEDDGLFKSLQTNYIKRCLSEVGPPSIQEVLAICAPFCTLQ